MTQAGTILATIVAERELPVRDVAVATLRWLVGGQLEMQAMGLAQQVAASKFPGRPVRLVSKRSHARTRGSRLLTMYLTVSILQAPQLVLPSGIGMPGLNGVPR